MSTIKELVDLGRTMGLEGDDLRIFISTQQTLQRDERQLEREEKERERLHAIALEDLKLKVAQQEQSNSNNSASYVSDPSCVFRPSLPVYKEGEDLTSYFTRFERIAGLGSLLSGKLADIYTTLTDDITCDYPALKSALLRSVNRIAEYYRSTFRTARIKVAETYQQFAIQLGRHFDSWLDACEVDKTFEELRSFVILDQFLASLPSDFQNFSEGK